MALAKQPFKSFKSDVFDILSMQGGDICLADQIYIPFPQMVATSMGNIKGPEDGCTFKKDKAALEAPSSLCCLRSNDHGFGAAWIRSVVILVSCCVGN